MDNIKLRSIQLTSFKCFDNTLIKFEDAHGNIAQWTVLLGNNNSGKTNLLKAIADLRPKLLNTIQSEDEEGPTYVPAAFYSNLNSRNTNTTHSQQSDVSSKLVSDDIETWQYNDSIWTLHNFKPENPFLIFGYGVTRYPSSTSLSENTSEECQTLFHPDRRLINIEEWLMQLDYAAKNGKEEASRLLDRIRELVCGNIFPEIQDFRFESSDELHNYVLFLTKDGWFRYTHLGFGYQSTLSWVIDLCKKMFDTYPLSDNPLHEGAIVLIDEIDLHLHPKWQRDIIKYLSDAFPKIQFIVTTHSPLVVQSMSDVNLYLLTRIGDKVHAEKSDVTNFVGWSVEEILRHTMKMSDDVYSDIYQKYFSLFDSGLDEENKAKVEEAYSVLSHILHPQNPARRLLEIQIASFRK